MKRPRMNPNSTPTKQAKSNAGNGHLALDPKALEAAKHSLDDGAVTPHFGPWREDIIKLLNDSLATELVCVMRYKRHHFTAVGLASPAIADEDRKSTRLNSSHLVISYAVFCLKKKNSCRVSTALAPDSTLASAHLSFVVFISVSFALLSSMRYSPLWTPPFSSSLT